MKQASGANGRVHVLRLQPGEDVRIVLGSWTVSPGIEAAAITSAVGSLTQANLRFAGQSDGTRITGDLEVISLSGTLSKHGLHAHLGVADGAGLMRGGHLLTGCLVRTTLELTIQEIVDIRMQRAKDEATGYVELDPQRI